MAILAASIFATLCREKPTPVEVGNKMYLSLILILTVTVKTTSGYVIC